MLTVMSGNGNADRDPAKDFLTTGRVGRRNALPNILSDHALTSTADLPDQLMALTTEDPKEGGSSNGGSMMTDEAKESNNEVAGTSS